MVLASLFNQAHTDFNSIISDQTEESQAYLECDEVATLIEALRWGGHQVTTHHHLPPRGKAEHRHFLLSRSQAPYVHSIDDDVLLEAGSLERMLSVNQREQCGFVGCVPTGIEYLGDWRPLEQEIELWEGPIQPEPFDGHAIPWERHRVNNAANPPHLEQRLVEHGETVRSEVAWVGGVNVLFDREKLLQVGGFSWWGQLPPEHAGEEVVVQFLLLNRFGGCGTLPAATYHLGLPTNVPVRRRNAPELFDSLLAQLTSQVHLGDGHTQ